MLAAENSAMAVNAFVGKSKPPTDTELSAALGGSRRLWNRLLAELAADLKLATKEWHTHSLKAGWSLRVKRKDRTIIYLAPMHGCFRASFALSDKAVQAAKDSRLPKPVLKMLDTAKRYAEGTALRIEVNRPEDIAVVKKLAKAKLEN